MKVMKKVILTPKSTEKIQDDIYHKMPFEKRMKLFFKVNNRVFLIASKKIKSKYPNLDPISLSKRLYIHISLKRKFYDDLFNRFLRKELKY